MDLSIGKFDVRGTETNLEKAAGISWQDERAALQMAAAS